jgi:hypothetical protein
MKRILAIVAFLLVLGPVPTAHGFVIEDLDLALGRTEENRIGAPIFDTEGIAAISFGKIASRIDPDDYVVYKMTKSQLTPRPAKKSPHYKLHPSIDLGSLLTDALRSEAGAMGFRSDAGPDVWQVGGSLHDLVLEFRPSGGGFGPALFYGYADLELEARWGGAEARTLRLRTYSMSHLYNGGFGLADEAKEALMRFLIDSAQEAVSRLNRELLHALPQASIASRLQSLQPDGEDQENDLRLIGLSGSPEAVPRLLDLLAAESDESDRVDILDALAKIGSEEAFDALSRRYAEEDEDCRLFTLKAMAAMGDDRAREFIARQGTTDKHLPCRVWARRMSSG